MIRSYTADFETTTNEEDCRVWAWGVSEIDNTENTITGTTLDEFMEWCEKHPDGNPKIYFHNLKFDIQFVLYWLLKHDFKHIIKTSERATKTFQTLIQGVDGGVEFLSQDADEGREEDISDVLHAQRQYLRYQYVLKTIHRQAGEAVRFSEDQAAAAKIRFSHDGATVGYGVAKPPLPKERIKAVVGVAGQDADADLGMTVIESRAQIFVLGGVHVHQPAVGGSGADTEDFVGVDPGVAAAESLLSLGGYMGAGICSFFHKRMSFR